MDVATTLSTWKPYINKSFICIEDALTKSKNKNEKPIARRLSNGQMEGINSTLEKVNMNGNGYTNFYRFRNRCIYIKNNK